MIPWDNSVNWRVEEFLEEAKRAQLVRQAPKTPSRLGEFVRNVARQFAVYSIPIDDPSSAELLWPRLSDYPYRPFARH